MVQGGVNSDNIIGAGGSDNLLGGNGDDSLGGNAGADHLDGGAGTDTATYSLSNEGLTSAFMPGSVPVVMRKAIP